MTPRQASRAVDAFTMLVVASVAVALAGLTWRLVGDRPADAPPPPSGSRPVPPLADVSPILALAPFGKPDAASAQPTSLALVLRGIVLVDPHSASTAMIAPTGGRPVAYTIGQAVPGGATVEDIALSRVLLRVNGRLERLELPRLSMNGDTPPPAQGSVAVPAPGSPSPTISIPGAPPTGDPGPLGLLGKLGAAPDGGAFRVGAEPSPEARRAGLLPGDVIDRINGMPATAVVNDRQLIAQALAAGPAQVDVLRGGKRISFSFALR